RVADLDFGVVGADKGLLDFIDGAIHTILSGLGAAYVSVTRALGQEKSCRFGGLPLAGEAVEEDRQRFQERSIIGDRVALPHRGADAGEEILDAFGEFFVLEVAGAEGEDDAAAFFVGPCDEGSWAEDRGAVF